MIKKNEKGFQFLVLVEKNDYNFRELPNVLHHLLNFFILLFPFRWVMGFLLKWWYEKWIMFVIEVTKIGCCGFESKWLDMRFLEA